MDAYQSAILELGEPSGILLTLLPSRSSLLPSDA